mmetsp:Transcript_16536/g.26401  ORF Transcript_16536/g.26401 Transcript_16536/m.26401 type:complete len:245 (+) Transcript_16536:1324-2058(+)
MYNSTRSDGPFSIELLIHLFQIIFAKAVGIAIKFKGFFKRIEEEKRPDHQWGILKTATSIMRREGIPQECLKGYVECMHKIIEYKAESLMGGEASTDVKTGNATVRRAEMAKGDVLETFFAYWDLICLRQNEFFRESFGSKSSRWKSDPTIEQLATFSIRFEGTLTAPPEKTAYGSKKTSRSKFSRNLKYSFDEEESVTELIREVLTCVRRMTTMEDECLIPPSPWIETHLNDVFCMRARAKSQ